MKHELDGIRVSLIDKNGTPVAEYANPYEAVSTSFHGNFGSRRVVTAFQEVFEVVVEFGHEYESYRSTGVLITVAGHHNDSCSKMQKLSFWIPSKDVHGIHRFTTVLFCGPMHRGVAHSETRLLRFPDVCLDYQTATTSWMMNNSYTANKGCVSVFIERGHLAAEADTPENYQQCRMSRRLYFSRFPSFTYRVVKGGDFRALRSQNGEDYLFEFRCVTRGEVAGLVEAEEEITPSETSNGFAVPKSAPVEREDDRVDEESDGHDSITTEEEPMDVDYDNASELSDRFASTAERQRTPSARIAATYAQRHSFEVASEEEDLYSATPRAVVAPHTAPASVEQELALLSELSQRAHTPPDHGTEEETQHAIVPSTSAAQLPNVNDLAEVTPVPEINMEPGTEQAAEETDIEDLQDQLEEIRLRRRIRKALKKQAAGSG